MVSCNTILSNVRSKLTAASGTAIRYVTEFPATRQDLPLSGPVAAVGIGRMTVENTKDEEGNVRYVTAKASSSMVTVTITLCIPKTKLSAGYAGTLDTLLAAAKNLTTAYQVLSITTGDAKYSSSVGALVIPVNIKINAGNLF